jgi:hypothetical protein
VQQQKLYLRCCHKCRYLHGASPQSLIC